LKRPQIGPVYKNFVNGNKNVDINWPFKDLYYKRNMNQDEE
jgi:hypothetical protein